MSASLKYAKRLRDRGLGRARLRRRHRIGPFIADCGRAGNGALARVEGLRERIAEASTDPHPDPRPGRERAPDSRGARG